MFVFGLYLIAYVTVYGKHDVAFIITGLVLIGLVPVDKVVSHLTKDKSQ